MRIPADAVIPAEKLTHYLLKPRPWDDKSNTARTGPPASASCAHLVTMESGWHVSFRHPETAAAKAMKPPALYERVALARDLDEHDLKRGDVATVVDFAPHPTGGPAGIVLEVTNALGDSLQVVVVTSTDIVPLSANEVLAVRQLVKNA